MAVRWGTGLGRNISRGFSGCSSVSNVERILVKTIFTREDSRRSILPLHLVPRLEISWKRCFGSATMTMSPETEMRNPSDFQKYEYAVPKDMVGKILGKDKQVVNQIKALSGSVIRLKKDEEHLDEEKSSFIIGGTKEQISKAIELIEQRITKRSMFDTKDGAPIWSKYRRNFKGQRPPEKTRHKCIRGNGTIVSGNPCPICRLKLEKSKEVTYKDVDLLKQFVCPHSGQILSPSVTGLCRQQQEKLVANIDQSRKYGLLPFTIPLPDDSPVEYKPVGIPSRYTRIRR